MGDIITFSYNAKVIDLDIYNIFRGVSLPLRLDCNGIIYIISEEESSYIYVRNYQDFENDKMKFKEDSGSWKGMWFDVIKEDGYIFTSYTYIKNSIRKGGYSNYVMKSEDNLLNS